MKAPTPTSRPARILPISGGLRPPTPLRLTSEAASTVSRYSDSGAVDAPPRATAPSSTWSFLKSVGLSHTSAPLDNVSTVVPMASMVRDAVTVPAVGLRVSSSVRLSVSVHGVSVVVAALLSTPSRSASEGRVTPALSGEVARTTRLVSASSSRAAALTSASVMPGSWALVNSYS